MARGRAPFRGGRQVSQRRQTAWAFGPEGTLAHTASAAQLYPTTISPTVEGLTVVRLRGEFLIFLTSVGSNVDGLSGAVGIGIVTAEAIAAGVAAVPTPFSDDDDELWMWHSYFNCVGASTSSPSQQPAATVRLQIDSKAMRKFPAGMVMFAACEVVETGVIAANSFILTRSLVKLS